MTIIYWYTVLTVLYIWDMRALPGLILYIHTVYCLTFIISPFFQGWEFAHRFSEWIVGFFCEKIKKNLVSDLSDLLTLLCFGEQHESSHPSLKKRERANRSWFFYFLHTKNVLKNTIFERIDHSLICHERPEQFAQSCSFDVGDLSDSLTVFHLIWAILANERMSKFPDLLFSFLRIENIKPCWGIELESFLAICQNIMCKGF